MESSVLKALAILLVGLPLSCSGSAPALEAAGSGASPTSTTSKCSPGSRTLGRDQGVEVREPGGGVIFRPALIGCRELLGSLTEDELAEARDALRVEVEKDIWIAGDKRFDDEYRQQLAALVNVRLEREVATEVLLADYFQWEARPRSPGR